MTMRLKRTLRSILISLAAILLALVAGGIIILFVGKNPLEAYYYLLRGAFGSVTSFGETLIKATPLIFTGMAAAISYRCGMYNLGAEGQFMMGAIASIWFVNSAVFIPAVPRAILSMVFAAAAGMLWGAIPGLLRTFHNTNEMIITIVLNNIAVLFMSFLYSGPLKEANIPQTAAVEEAARLPRFLSGTRAHIGIFIGLIVAFILYYFMFYTYKGYQFRAVGLNPTAARVNGFPVRTIMLCGFLISGAIAGLGGGVEVLGTSYRLQTGFANGFGFDGVAIALIGLLHPLSTVIVAYLFAVLKCGANAMQVATGITVAVVDIMEAIIIIFCVVGTAIVSNPTLRVRLQSKRKNV